MALDLLPERGDDLSSQPTFSRLENMVTRPELYRTAGGHRFLANQFRVSLHSAAYVLVHTFQTNLLRGTALATATFETIRLKLLKIGAKVIEMKTRIKVHLPTLTFIEFQRHLYERPAA